MRSWGLVFKPRGGIAGTGFGAAIVASAVSVCAPIESVLLPGRKTCERSACVQALSFRQCRNAVPGPGGSADEVGYEVLNTKCGAWAWGCGERSPSSLLAAAGKQGNDSLKANHYLRVILCCALRARYH